ncbi:hypothetical protein GUJ93_ZPchr0011g27008 [Zizania palustris]|uniref:Uncharacterized protein n=1 Tax=Zizania palustris TaxID=103762 RepID=A0A8J6BS22_ZIZPA|nr:hypothetical protein GUJ93_ZPchr0011g27008 [Zizania palustris]
MGPPLVFVSWAHYLQSKPQAGVVCCTPARAPTRRPESGEADAVMDAGECSNSKPCASSPDDGGFWAKLVPADSAFPEVELDEDNAVVCSRVTPAAGGEEVVWCQIRRGGDASPAMIRNLSRQEGAPGEREEAEW